MQWTLRRFAAIGGTEYYGDIDEMMHGLAGSTGMSFKFCEAWDCVTEEWQPLSEARRGTADPTDSWREDTEGVPSTMRVYHRLQDCYLNAVCGGAAAVAGGLVLVACADAATFLLDESSNTWFWVGLVPRQ